MVIKTVHTVIWCFFNGVMIYLFYAVATNTISIWVWIGLSLFLVEGIILAIFRYQCPLTILARRYSDSTKDNFDIYLPNWLARHTKVIYTSLLGIVIVILILQLAIPD